MPKSIQKLLIANRGEIALRIVRACSDLGICAVAVYSDADRDSPHVSAADEAYPIGPASATESYLCMQRLIDTAHACGADAVHPGYGFLAENADFAEMVENAGMVFVGPSAEAIRLLGSKSGAKEIMRAASVPVVPGYHGDDQSVETLRREADLIGYPILIKASAGGGGRGMRVVRSSDAFDGELEEARREATASFGDGTVLLEHYIADPRHIEFQIFGDHGGSVIHLFERECSIQRRHQKIIEESPSPVLSDELRTRMANAAVRAGQAVNYTNAGTVEFLFEERSDGDHQFYFLEVNTRLQVEHPVTECVTGLDLVRMQLEVAAGKLLSVNQAEVNSRGHAIEARIYAEDPEHAFAPSFGKLKLWMPPGGPGIRVDSGYTSGMDVSLHYDAMLAKLIAYGEDRSAALARLQSALRQFHVVGVKTIIPYLIDVVAHPSFVIGATTTGFIPQHFGEWRGSEQTIPDEALLALACAETLGYRRSGDSTSDMARDDDVFSPWTATGSWRVFDPANHVRNELRR